MKLTDRNTGKTREVTPTHDPTEPYTKLRAATERVNNQRQERELQAVKDQN